MTLRPDEIFVVDRLVAHLGGNENASWKEGEDPPDAYFIIDNEMIAVEITQLSPIMVHPDGSVENRVTPDMTGGRLLDQLNVEYRDQMASDALFVHLRVPLDKPRRLKRQIRSTLDKIIGNRTFPTEWQEVQVGNDVFGLLHTIPRSNSGKRIIGIVENTLSSSDIAANTTAILSNRIDIKDGILAKAGWNGEKWLALFNQYWLADEDSYQLAYDGLQAEHDFSSIWLINDDGSVYQLYGKT